MKEKILYIGDKSGTSAQRAQAFSGLGFDVNHISPRDLLPRNPWVDKFEWHCSPILLAKLIESKIAAEAAVFESKIAWVDSGSLVSPSLVRRLQCTGHKVLNFNHDDPFGQRDWRRFSAYRQAAPAYDLVVVVREPNVEEAMRLGVKNVLLVKRTADEIAHFPRAITPEIESKWASDVSFVGTWMPERGPFLLELIRAGIDLAIYGGGWTKAPEWPMLKLHHRADHINGDAYAYAIQCSKISLGLLSIGNRGLHTTRSLEIPMLGGLLCAERTLEHLQMYREDAEAVFWSGARECAEKCRNILGNPTARGKIATAGRKRMLESGNTSEGLIMRLLSALKSL